MMSQSGSVRSRDSRPLAVRVYEQISSDIIDGKIPAGSALVQEQVAAQYGVSRTPVRDALTQISLEGLATLVPGQGYIVNDLTTKTVRDVYEVRYTLEALAARQACGQHTPQQLIRLRALIEEFETLNPFDAAGLFDMARRFHTALIEPCPNEYLLTTLASMWEHPIQRRITMTYRQGPENQQNMARDHRRILEAMKAGDVETVVDVLRFCHDPNDARTSSPT